MEFPLKKFEDKKFMESLLGDISYIKVKKIDSKDIVTLYNNYLSL